MGICPCTQNFDICMEVPKKQQPSPMLDILYCQVHVCKWGTGCAPVACNQNTMCDHLNTAIRENTNKLKLTFKLHASIFFFFFFLMLGNTSKAGGPSDSPLQSKPRSHAPHPLKFSYTKLIKSLAFHQEV